MATRWWVLMVLVLGTVLSSHAYMVYGTDKVAAITGYFVGLGVIPVVFGIALGTVGAVVAARVENVDVKGLIFIPAVCGASALILIGWTVFMMS